jgi:hypothetical protein
MTSKHDPEKVTLAFCRRWLEQRLERKLAVKCPCCRKPAHKSRRHITRKMCVTLVKMYLQHTTSTKGLRDGNGDYAKLRHWGLVEQVSYGRWRLTPLGGEWLRGRAEVRRTAITYNKCLVRFDDGPMTVFDCYGNRAAFAAMVARVKGGANK